MFESAKRLGKTSVTCTNTATTRRARGHTVSGAGPEWSG